MAGRQSPHDGFARVAADPDRFWQRVAKAGPDECWLWTGTRHQKGYGLVYFRRAGKLTSATSSRVAFALTAGLVELPGRNEQVCHSCDNPPCCNPAHLWLGTPAENSADAESKGRKAKKLTEPQVLEILASSDSCKDLAARFGVTAAMVSAIQTGHSWKRLTAGAARSPRTNGRRLSRADVELVRASASPSKELAERLGGHGLRDKPRARRFYLEVSPLGPAHSTHQNDNYVKSGLGFPPPEAPPRAAISAAA